MLDESLLARHSGWIESSATSESDDSDELPLPRWMTRQSKKRVMADSKNGDEGHRWPKDTRRLKALVPRGQSVWTAGTLPSRSRSSPSLQPLSSLKSESGWERPISCYCTADTYDVQAIYEHYNRNGQHPEVFKDVVHVLLPHPSRDVKVTTADARGYVESPIDVFFFPYGVMIAWGVNRSDNKALRNHILKFENKPLREEDYEEFSFTFGKTFKVDRLKDEIMIRGNLSPQAETLAKCAISHGLALCVKLNVFEDAIEKTVQGTKHLPEELARDGSIKMCSKDISRIIGDMFIQRNSVNLHTDILDTPDFFWEHADLEPLYALTRSYLDINKRADILNTRLDVLKVEK